MKKRINKKTFLLAVVACMAVIGGQAQSRDANLLPENVVYLYRGTVRSIVKRAQNGPMFMIYPDKTLNEKEAETLVVELGLKKLVDNETGSVGVFKPIGDSYNEITDFEAYKKFIDASRVISNLKIIGLGHGATFVNDVISQQPNEVAGIFTYGGKLNTKKQGKISVPTYVALANKKLTNFYVAANQAKEVGRDPKHVVYQNENEPLQRVVMSLDKKQCVAEALKDAWDTLLSKNYRYSNLHHTHYMGAKFGQYGAYELEPYNNLSDLGLTREAVRKKLWGPESPGNREFLWYEYVPKQCTNANVKSIPLILMLHGHQNDNRTQSETSGFLEIAEKEGVILAEIEWQGLGGANGSDMALGASGIEMVALDVMKRYPQIDPSRVYVQGLSAGAMNSAALGIEKSYLFAAVAGHSGGIFKGMPVYGFSYESLLRNAQQKRGKVETAYFLTVGTDDDTIGFPTKDKHDGSPYYNALSLYTVLNDMPALEIDFDAEPILGVKMQDRETIVTNKGITLEKGVLYKSQIPLIQFTAIMHYGHWNFRPMAKRMWDFFRHYSRDIETGKLIYQP